MTTMTATLMQTDLPLPGRRQGKVRDIYEATTTAGADALLIVASDRISAFDVVMPNGIPGKGAMLTQLSAFWFDLIERHFGDRLTHHLISTDPADIAGLGGDEVAALRGRVTIGRRCRVIPVECVARGYIAGSGWSEYRAHGTVCGIRLPADLGECGRLPQPVFSPATKADTGHDQNIDFERCCQIVGEKLATTLRDRTLEIYAMAHEYALERGIILADTKFEFGLPLEDGDQDPILIDEALTPDSSRFWPADQYAAGHDQPSFDKQYVRNYLQELVDNGRWNKEPPAPALPEQIVRNTAAKYRQAYRTLTGSNPDF